MNNQENPAFPHSLVIENEFGSGKSAHSGLTKREYFAGLALQGIISEGSYDATGEGIQAICGSAIKISDELLKQLESTKNNNK